MNKRYLWRGVQILSGNKAIIWGLIDDIWHFYHRKISPFDQTSICSKRIAQEAMRKRSASRQSQNKSMLLSSPAVSTRPHNQDIQLNNTCTEFNSPNRFNKYQNSQNKQNPVTSLSATTSPQQINQLLHQRGYNNRRKAKNQVDRLLDLRKNLTYKRTLSPKQQGDSVERQAHQIPFKLEKVSDEQKDLIRQWLKSLKFQTFLGVEQAELLKNPFRNGVLLCQLLSLFQGRQVKGVYYCPQSIVQAQFNVDLAFKILDQINKQADQPIIHYSLLNMTEQILRGDRNAIWCILNQLLQNAPSHLVSQYDTYCEPTLQTKLPYSKQDLHRLEKSLIYWLKREIFSMTSPFERLVDLQEQIKSGRLFIRITQKLLNIKISGAYRDPKTMTSCISNVRKALQPLRKDIRMSQKFLWDEKKIVCNLERGSIFGLLQDLHRYSDGLPARRTNSSHAGGYFFDGPYLGTLQDRIRLRRYNQNMSQNLEMPHQQIVSSQDRVNSQDDQQHNDNYNKKNNINIEQIPLLVPETFGHHPQSARNTSNHGLLHNDKYSPLQSSGYFSNGTQSASGFRDDQIKYNATNPFVPKSNTHIDINPQRYYKPTYPQTVYETTERTQADERKSNDKILLPKRRVSKDTQSQVNYTTITPIIKTNSIENQRYGDQTVSTVLVNNSQTYPANFEYFRDQQQFQQQQQYQQQQQNIRERYFNSNILQNSEEGIQKIQAKRKVCNNLINWMISLDVNVPKDLNLELNCIQQFKDGVFLAQIVSILQLNKVPGIDPKPQSQAAALRNIRKSLDVISKKSSIPIQYLHAEREIHRGNGKVIVGLLAALRSAYKIRTGSNNRFKSRFKNYRQLSIKSRKRSQDAVPYTCGQQSHQQLDPKISNVNHQQTDNQPLLGPYGSYEPNVNNETQSKNWSLTPRTRQKMLQKPAEAWN